jgi:hypothetical protein
MITAEKIIIPVTNAPHRIRIALNFSLGVPGERSGVAIMNY